MELTDYPVKIILFGEELKTPKCMLWGSAQFKGFSAIIKKVIEKNLWHELSHILGAEDHYEENEKRSAKKICESDECIMRLRREEGILCNKSLEEIRANSP